MKDFLSVMLSVFFLSPSLIYPEKPTQVSRAELCINFFDKVSDQARVTMERFGINVQVKAMMGEFEDSDGAVYNFRGGI